MHTRQQSARVLLVASLLLVQTLAGGCAMITPPTTDLSKQAIGKTDPVSILYSCELMGAPGPGKSAGAAKNYLLCVKYPHASAKPGYARVELVIEERDHGATGSVEPSLSSRIGNMLPGVKLADGVQEAWSMDIPQKDAQSGLDELKAGGFFADLPEGGKVHTTVIVESGKQTTGKRWGRVTSLDRLINQVRKEGRLASHVAPPADVAAMLERAQSMSNKPTTVAQMPSQFSGPQIERLPAIF